MNNTKYLYFELSFYKDDCYEFECVAEDLDEVRDYFQWWETELDDEDANAEIRVKGVGLTRSEFESLKKEQNEFE